MCTIFSKMLSCHLWGKSEAEDLEILFLFYSYSIIAIIIVLLSDLNKA